MKLKILDRLGAASPHIAQHFFWLSVGSTPLEEGSRTMADYGITRDITLEMRWRTLGGAGAQGGVWGVGGIRARGAVRVAVRCAGSGT